MFLLPGVLELCGGFLLDAEDDIVGAADADGGVALADGLEGVFDLEEVAVGREDGDRAIIASHCEISYYLSIWRFRAGGKEIGRRRKGLCQLLAGLGTETE